MRSLWQWFTARGRTPHRRTRTARLAHVPWHERWGEQQAVHVPPQGDTLDGRLAEEVCLMLRTWW